MLLNHLFAALGAAPTLLSEWDIQDTLKYVALVIYIKPIINRLNPTHQTTAPSNLSVNIHDFLKLSLHTTDELSKLAWATLGEIIWQQHISDKLCKEFDRVSSFTEDFLTYGLPRGIGA